MARITYQGYGITELRTWARTLGIKGRSKMNGDELVAACFAEVDTRRGVLEQAVLPAVKVGALLRHKSTGDIIRVTGEVYTWEPYGALCVTADYVETGRWGTDQADRERSAAYDNECNTRRTDGGPRHPIWQYEAV